MTTSVNIKVYFDTAKQQPIVDDSHPIIKNANTKITWMVDPAIAGTYSFPPANAIVFVPIKKHQHVWKDAQPHPDGAGYTVVDTNPKEGKNKEITYNYAITLQDTAGNTYTNLDPDVTNMPPP